MNEPITIRVRKARGNVKAPEGMEISMNADGSGGAVPEKNPSPAKCWKGYERVPGTKKLTPGSCKKK